MSIEKEIITQTGAPAKYWRLEDAHFSRAKGTFEIVMSGFYTQEARVEGRFPIFPPVTISGPMNADWYGLIYGILKLPFEGNIFEGGIDIIDDPWRNPPINDTITPTGEPQQEE